MGQVKGGGLRSTHSRLEPTLDPPTIPSNTGTGATSGGWGTTTFCCGVYTSWSSLITWTLIGGVVCDRWWLVKLAQMEVVVDSLVGNWCELLPENVIGAQLIMAR